MEKYAEVLLNALINENKYFKMLELITVKTWLYSNNYYIIPIETFKRNWPAKSLLLKIKVPKGISIESNYNEKVQWTTNQNYFN
jgi:hypothetical protein